MNGEVLKPMMKPQKTLLESLASFDWRGAGIVLSILGMASLFYLGKFFITRDEYKSDMTHLMEMFDLKLNQLQKNQDETKNDVKEILQEQRKANK